MSLIRAKCFPRFVVLQNRLRGLVSKPVLVADVNRRRDQTEVNAGRRRLAGLATIRYAAEQ